MAIYAVTITPKASTPLEAQHLRVSGGRVSPGLTLRQSREIPKASLESGIEMKAKQDLGAKDKEPRFIKRRLDPFVIGAGHGSSSRLTIPTSVCAASAMAAKRCAPEVAMAATPKAAARSARFARSNYVPLDNLGCPDRSAPAREATSSLFGGIALATRLRSALHPLSR